jgi:heterodisulfide reductase subunit C
VEQSNTPQLIELGRTRETILRDIPDGPDSCLTCGICSGRCMATGIDGFDTRKIVRMAMLGMEEELVGSRWPWICTMCGRCQYVCPMDIDILGLIRTIRSLRNQDDVPGNLHKGIMAALKTGNNFSIPKDDFIFIMEDVAEEFAEEEGFQDFKFPLDKKGANVLCTVHGKLPFANTDDMKFWWKIFYAAGEDWTVPSENWEGVNWAIYTGNDEAMKTMVGRIVENMEKLEAKNLLLPE